MLDLSEVVEPLCSQSIILSDIGPIFKGSLHDRLAQSGIIVTTALLPNIRPHSSQGKGVLSHPMSLYQSPSHFEKLRESCPDSGLTVQGEAPWPVLPGC